MKKALKTIIFTIVLTIFFLYFGIVFLLPQTVNNKNTIKKIQSLIYDKTKTETNITGLNLTISPNLTAVLNIENIDAKNNNVTVANINDFVLNYKLLQNRLTSIGANNIFIDGNYLKQFKKEKKEKKNNNFELNYIPKVYIRNFVFKSDEVSINAENIESNENYIKLKAAINTPFIKETIKLGDSGFFQIEENEVKANKYKITLGNSHLYLNGIITDKNRFPNLNINGEKIPVSEIMPMLLHFQKSKDSSKKFLENFKNFTGTVSVNLKLNKDGIWGECVANNLGTNAVWFDIPLFFKEAVFNFKGKTIDSVAEGILGNEKVIHTLDVTNLGTPEKEVIGTMKTTLTKKFKYVPNLTVLNSANVSLVYKIKNKKPDVFYNIDIPRNSGLIYNSFYLGLRDYRRKIYANTFKDNNNLYLKEYKYSYSASYKENVILSGDGLFIKNIDKNNPDKFIPQYLTIRTKGYAPTSVIGSFGEKIRGGEFKGDLKYDFKNNQVLGNFDIINTRHKAFRVDKAHIISKNGILNITSNGLYKGEKYSAELNAKNNIFGETLIYNMNLFLDKLILETTPHKHKKNKPIDAKKFSKKFKDIDITINTWEIVINKIIRDKFVLQNVKLIGSLKNHIFDFKINDLNFADGTINARGFYDFAKNISKITFEAENINSNKVAEMTLNLKDQIEGIASAKVDIDAKDMFRFLDVHCVFDIKEGFLPKLGDTEFMLKSSKYKLSEITNFDLTQKDLMKDDIKGSFDVHNTEINNIDITTWHELSAVYLEGSYEMEKQHADLQLFWKYSKDASKGIRIFGIPLSLILKVVFRPEYSMDIYQSQFEKVPAINSDKIRTNYYRIQLKGDINNNKVNLKLKEIR